MQYYTEKIVLKSFDVKNLKSNNTVGNIKNVQLKY